MCLVKSMALGAQHLLARHLVNTIEACICNTAMGQRLYEALDTRAPCTFAKQPSLGHGASPVLHLAATWMTQSKHIPNVQRPSISETVTSQAGIVRRTSAISHVGV